MTCRELQELCEVQSHADVQCLAPRASDVYGEGDTFLSHWLSAFRKNKKGGLSLYGKVGWTLV